MRILVHVCIGERRVCISVNMSMRKYSLVLVWYVRAYERYDIHGSFYAMLIHVGRGK